MKLEPWQRKVYCVIWSDNSCGKLKMAPKGTRPKPLEPVQVTLYGKRGFADMMKLRALRWGSYPGVSG